MGQSAAIAQRNRRDAAPAEHAFKPLALPALAAAVQMNKQRPHRTDVKRDIPAVLREDAVQG
jgi:hypothetical protein